MPAGHLPDIRDIDALMLRHHLNANQSAGQGESRAIPVEIFSAPGDAFLSASQCRLGPLQINILGKLGCFRKNRNAVRQHFRKSANDRKQSALAARRAIG